MTDDFSMVSERIDDIPLIIEMAKQFKSTFNERRPGLRSYNHRGLK